jgi:hypothetical protein
MAWSNWGGGSNRSGDPFELVDGVVKKSNVDGVIGEKLFQTVAVYF